MVAGVGGYMYALSFGVRSLMFVINWTEHNLQIRWLFSCGVISGDFVVMEGGALRFGCWRDFTFI